MELDNFYNFLKNILNSQKGLTLIYSDDISIESLDFYIDLINSNIFNPNDKKATRKIQDFLDKFDSANWETNLLNPEKFLEFVFFVVEKGFLLSFNKEFETAIFTHALKTMKGEVTTHPLHDKWTLLVSKLKSNKAGQKIFSTNFINFQGTISDIYFQLYKELLIIPPSVNDYESFFLRTFIPLLNNPTIFKFEWIFTQLSKNPDFLANIYDIELKNSFFDNIRKIKDQNPSFDPIISEILKLS